MKTKLKIRFCGIGVTIASVFLVGIAQSNFAYAEEGSMVLDKNPQEGFKQLLDSITPDNLFNTKNEEIAPILPVYSSMISDIKLVSDPHNKKSYNAGNTLNYEGSLSYSSKTIKGRLEEKQRECLSDLSNRSNEEKKSLCAIGEMSSVPSLSNIGILVKVWKVDDSNQRTKTGDFLIDEFYGVENLEISDNETVKFNFKWKIPESSETGKYYAAFFINSEKRFNLDTFPVFVWSPQARFDFEVVGKKSDPEVRSGVEINKDKLTINGGNYSQISLPPTITPIDGKISVSFPVKNLDIREQEVTVKYELRNWVYGAQAETIETKEETEDIKPGNSVDFNYAFSPNDRDSFYTVKAVAMTASSLSTVDIYLVREDSAKGMISFLGLSKNNSGVIHPMFCALNAQWKGNFSGTVKISVTDANGKEIANWNGKGLLEPPVERCFELNKIILDSVQANKCLTIQGEVLNDGQKVVDSIKTSVNCGKKKPDKSVGSQYFPESSNKSLISILFIVMLLLVATLIYLKVKKDEPKSKI